MSEAPPKILVQPTTQVVNAGDSATFSITAVGGSPLKFQWILNGQPLTNSTHIAGADSGVLTVTNVAKADLGEYRAIVSNAYGSIMSAPVQLHLDYSVSYYPVALSKATATASLLPDYAPWAAVDGNEFGDSGWALPTGGSNESIVFQTSNDIGHIGGTRILVTIHVGRSTAAFRHYRLGRFRLYTTSADRSTYADGNAIGGNLGEDWHILTPKTVSSSAGVTLSHLPDGSILATNASSDSEDDAVYTIYAETTMTDITGFRVEALKDGSLPNSGPGLNHDGNFVVQEVHVQAAPLAFGPPVVLLAEEPMMDLRTRAKILKVRAAGPGPFAYQWFKDGKPVADKATIVGSRSDTLQILGESSADSGSYAVNISNDFGTTTSQASAVVFESSPTLGIVQAADGITLEAPAEPSLGVISLYKADNIQELIEGPRLVARTNAPVVGPFIYNDIAAGEGYYFALRENGAEYDEVALTDADEVDVVAEQLESQEESSPNPQVVQAQRASSQATQGVSPFSRLVLLSYVDRASGKPKTTLALPDQKPYEDPPGLSWPLNREIAEVPVRGTFGEWRGNARDINRPDSNKHAGLDLATSNRTEVLASRAGVVADVSSVGQGYQLTLDHLDGQYTRYLHIEDPSSRNPIGTFLRKGDFVGFSGYGHLHFEVRRGPAGLRRLQEGDPDYVEGETPTSQTVGEDPLQVAEFTQPRRARQKDCRLWMVGLTQQEPSDFIYGRGSVVKYGPKAPETGAASDYVYCVLRISHQEPQGADKVGRLSPKGVAFWPSGAGSEIEIEPRTEPDLNRLMPRANKRRQDAGYARYKNGNSLLLSANENDWFQFWFKWSTAAYSNALVGPREFEVTARNYSDGERDGTKWHLKWGPQIESLKQLSVGADGTRVFRVETRAWIGDWSASQGQRPPNAWSRGKDRYIYELPEGGAWTNGSRSLIVEVDGSHSESFEPVRSVNFFSWKPRSSDSGGVLVVRSETAPNIGDQAALSGFTASVVTTARAGYEFRGVPYLYSVSKKTLSTNEDYSYGPAKTITASVSVPADLGPDGGMYPGFISQRVRYEGRASVSVVPGKLELSCVASVSDPASNLRRGDGTTVSGRADGYVEYSGVTLNKTMQTSGRDAETVDAVLNLVLSHGRIEGIGAKQDLAKAELRTRIEVGNSSADISLVWDASSQVVPEVRASTTVGMMTGDLLTAGPSAGERALKIPMKLQVGVPARIRINFIAEASVRYYLAGNVSKASSDFPIKLSFPLGSDVFSVPDGYTVTAPAAKITDNRYYP